MKRSCDIMTVDRISDLPEPILHHIMSYLPFKNIVQISILSKEWKQVWHAFPGAEVDVDEIFSRRKMILSGLEGVKMLNYLEETLQTLSGLERSKILTHLEQIRRNRQRQMIQCLDFAITSEFNELVLVHGYGYVIALNKLPQMVFWATSLEVLVLSHCKLEPPQGDVKLSSLKRLTLDEVYADDQVIASLISGSPLIEYLRMAECVGFKSLELVDLNKLKELELVTCFNLKRVVIKSLNLNKLLIYQPFSPFEINVSPK